MTERTVAVTPFPAIFAASENWRGLFLQLQNENESSLENDREWWVTLRFTHPTNVLKYGICFNNEGQYVMRGFTLSARPELRCRQRRIPDQVGNDESDLTLRFLLRQQRGNDSQQISCPVAGVQRACALCKRNLTPFQTKQA